MGFQNVAAPPGPHPRAPGVGPLHESYRSSFPVTQNLVYLNHAAIAPLCLPAANAIRRLTDDACSFGSHHYSQWLAAYHGLRSSAATLINAAPDEIAILKNTSEGIAAIANGIDWKPGDRIIAFTEEFPANFFPWKRLASRGVQVTWLSIYSSLDEIAAVLPGARLLSISFVNYLSGHRIDLAALGDLCRQHGCFFFVDAIQGLGVFPLDVEACHIDALSADGHKWLLGPEGLGILYVRRNRLEEIEPVEFGWTNTAHHNDYASRDMSLRPGAARYECGTLNTAGVFGLRAALDFLLEVGISRVSSAVLSLADQIERGVRGKGYSLITPREPATASGIVTFRHPSLDAPHIVSILKENRVAAASRQGWVRTSPHFYLSPADIDRFLESLPPA